MQDKTVVITGATNGIGKATARVLAEKGAHLVLIARNGEKADIVRQGLFQETGNQNIDILLADLSDLAQVKRVGKEVLEKYPRIDVLLNNAGAYFQSREETVDKYEGTFALNHLAYFVLTRTLLDRLKENPAEVRIVNVASTVHARGVINFDDLMLKKSYDGFQAYCNSKLANVMFTYELARRLADTSITVNALHPGAVSTGFGNNSEGLIKWILKLGKPFLSSPEKGARTSIYLTSSPEVEGVSGKYFTKCKTKDTVAQSYNQADCERLWKVSEELVAFLT